jgi:hypothetical protein
MQIFRRVSGVLAIVVMHVQLHLLAHEGSQQIVWLEVRRKKRVASCSDDPVRCQETFTILWI